MLINPQSRWALRLATTGVWGLAAASVAYWGLKLGGASGAPMAAVVSSAVAAPVDSLKVARLLGATDAPLAAAPVVNASSRFSLVGVVAGLSKTGTALIIVDGKPARPYHVGAAVDTGYVLQSVGPRVAVLGSSLDAPASMTLEMPKPGSTGSATPVLSVPGMTPNAPTRYVPPPAPPQPQIQRPASVPGGPGMGGPAASVGKRNRDKSRTGLASAESSIQ
jgi:general secretion pathway protein C